MQETKFKHEKATALLTDLAGEFFARETAGPALITVTRVELSPTRREAKVYLSILPREHEKAVVGFSERHAGALADYVRSRSKMRLMPKFIFLVDEGEKHRQRIDELLNADKQQ